MDVAKEVNRAEQLSPSREPDLEQWEERVEHDIREDTKIPETQREAIIQSRGEVSRQCAERRARLPLNVGVFSERQRVFLDYHRENVKMDRDAEFVALVGDAVDDSADDAGWAHLVAVGNIIRNKKPDFDARNYGYKKLWELLDASSYSETRPINNIVMVRREKR